LRSAGRSINRDSSDAYDSLRVTIFVTIGSKFQQPGEISDPDKQLKMLVLRFCWCLPISRICIMSPLL